MQVLSALPRFPDARLLVGNEHFDDAGVAAVDDRIALVQTVDFFPPVVDDPWWFGRIAAANALSDVYAMGATPFSALNIVAFPTSELPLAVLGDILRGGGDALHEAGAMLLGGHSIVDTGVKYGVAVTGLVRPGAQVTNAGARPGDRLYLTKPLGTGCITTAGRKDVATAEELQAACASMGKLNRAACEAMVAVGVHAATDVTGFGLLGHGHEMAAASGVELRFSSAALPLLPGARRLLELGLQSGSAGRTRKHLAERLQIDSDVAEPLQRLALDSETSGGLLIAVPAGRASALEAACAERGVIAVAIGEAVALESDRRASGTGGRVRLMR